MVPSLHTSSAPSKSSVFQVFKALEDLYELTSGDDWENTWYWPDSIDNWDTYNMTWCNWYGVVCDGYPKSITEMILENNNLQGRIPSSISV